MKLSGAILSLFFISAGAYNGNAQFSRRDVFRSVATTGLVTAFVAQPTLANALEACPKGSQNCIRTTWTPPAGYSKADAIAGLKKVVESYPQEGQEKVDLGGWRIAEDNFDSGIARIEYKSGIGPIAKFLNGGKPFIDDLKFEIADDGVVQVRSSSRIGDSDLGVNQKRLNFFVRKLREAGWSAPDAAY